MTIHALLYASRARLAGPEAAAAVADLVAVSRARNARLGVTGALVYSGGHFAQILEGGSAAVAELMRSIGRDPRHADVTVLSEGPTGQRRFADWSLAYAGPATFVDSIIAGTLAGAGAPRSRNEARLQQLLEELAAA